MQRWKRCAWYGFGLFQLIIFMVAAVKPANAYVDPGSGLLFFQVGGSMLAGAMFVLRTKIRKLFRLGNPAEANGPGEESTGAKDVVSKARTGTDA
jgi:hypothetical protein